MVKGTSEAPAAEKNITLDHLYVLIGVHISGQWVVV